MKSCVNCGHHESQHIRPTPPESFSTENWVVAKCFNWDVWVCPCEEYIDE